MFRCFKTILYECNEKEKHRKTIPIDWLNPILATNSNIGFFVVVVGSFISFVMDYFFHS